MIDQINSTDSSHPAKVCEAVNRLLPYAAIVPDGDAVIPVLPNGDSTVLAVDHGRQLSKSLGGAFALLDGEAVTA